MPIRLTYCIKILAIAMFVTFIVQQTGDQFFGTHLLAFFGLTPAGFIYHHYYWQIFTYAFLHTDVMHLFFNLLMLVFIGAELEMAWGTAQFLKYYFFCSTSSALIYLFIQSVFLKGDGMYIPLIGASGALYGLFTAYGLIFGERVLLFMMLFPLKAKHFVLVLALIQVLTTIYSPGGVWSSLSLLAGMGAGFVYLWGRARWIIAMKSKSKTRSDGYFKKKKRPKHLKLVVNKPNDLDEIDKDSEEHPKTWH